MKKKFIIIIFILMLLVLSISVIGSELEADITPPVIHAETLTVNNKNAQIGDTLTISLEVTDDRLGVKEVNIEYIEPITSDVKIFYLYYNEESKLFETTFTVDDTYELGEWKVSCIMASDGEQYNELWSTDSTTSVDKLDLSSGNFTITGTDADIIPPTINKESLKVNSSSLNKGDTLKISLEVTDDKSEIEEVCLEYIKPITKDVKLFYLKYNEETRLFEVEFEIDDTYQSGLWEISYINASDGEQYSELWSTASSTAMEKVDLSSGNFTITGTDADITPPTINKDKLTVSDKEVEIGDTLKISLEVTDDKSEIQEVYLEYIKPITKDVKLFYLKYNEETGLFEVELEIDDTYQSGLWEISLIAASDGEQYSELWSTASSTAMEKVDLSSGNFTVIRNNTDITPPEINIDSLSVSEKNVISGDVVTYSLEMTDNVGIERISMNLGNDNYYGFKEVVFEYDESSKLYKGNFEIKMSTTAGRWYINNITATDVNNNVSSFFLNDYDFSNADIYNYEHYTNPTFTENSLRVSSAEVTQNEKVTISFSASDPFGLKSAIIVYINPITEEEVEVDTKLENDTFTGEISFEERGFNGLWQIKRIEILSAKDYGTIVYNSNVEQEYQTSDLSSGDFTTHGLIEDTEKPVLESFSIDRNEINLYESVKLFLKAYDVDSDIEKVLVNYTLADGTNTDFNFELIDDIYTISFVDYPIGEYKANYILIEDTYKNVLKVEDVNKLDFEIHSPLKILAPSLYVGTYETFSLESLYYPYSLVTLEWLSSDTNIATVNPTTGEVETYGEEGNVTITARVSGIPSIYATIDIIVGDADEEFKTIDSIQAKYTFLEMEIGNEIDLEATVNPLDVDLRVDTLFYESQDDSVASVSPDGKVIANGAGQTYIDIYSQYYDKHISIPVNVVVYTTGLTLDVYELKLNDAIREYIINYTITPNDTTFTSLNYESSNTDVVTVDNGLITAIGNGTAIVTVATSDGRHSKTINVTVEGLRFEICDFSCEGADTVTYNGKEQVPEYIIMDGDYRLIENVDYIVEGYYNINVGNATAIIRGINNYKGDIEKLFVITPLDITSLDWQLESEEVIYEGVPAEPQINLNNDNLSEVYNQNIKVTYLNNSVPGMANVVIEGIDNFTGKIVKQFKIIKLFKDVPETEWYFMPVKYCKENEIILGYGETREEFKPNEKMTRGMFVTILYRMAGVPDFDESLAKEFPDVHQDWYYARAIKWASAVGIVNGYDDGNFGPDNPIRRQDLAIMIRSFARVILGKDISVKDESTLLRFKDYSRIDDYAKESALWAVENKVMNGTQEGYLNPHGIATRAETAAMLYNYLENNK